MPVVICSNTFWEGCKDEEARDWIEKNSVYVEVKEKVFEEPEAELRDAGIPEQEASSQL